MQVSILLFASEKKRNSAHKTFSDPYNTSVLSMTYPSSISLILCSAGVALFHRISNTYCCCCIFSLTLLYTACGIVVDSTRPISLVDIAMYSVSLTPKYPLTPSEWRSSTFSIICLQYEILSFVISVINLNLVPLVFPASNIAFFIGSIAKGAKDNDLTSAK